MTEALRVHAGGRSILVLDMSFTLDMIRQRRLDSVLESLRLDGYFSRVISVHPLAGIFEAGDARFGRPKVHTLANGDLFVEGSFGAYQWLRLLPPLNFLCAQWQLVATVLQLGRAAGVSVIRIGDPYYLGLLGLLLSRLLGRPLAIRTCFNYDLLHRTTGKPVFPRLFRFRWIEKFIERRVFPRCGLVAGANQNNLEYAFENGADSRYGVVFRYGNLVNPLHFEVPERRSEGRSLLNEIGIRGRFLVTVCRLEPMKQPEHAIKVLHELVSMGHDVALLLIGDGSMRQELAGMVRSMELETHVVFAGNRPQDWIARILPCATIVVSPHMGRALTEACLAAVPVVAYDYDWQREIVIEGKTGHLVANGDWQAMAGSCARLLHDADSAARMGREAREQALAMMDPRMLNRIEAGAYESLFARWAPGMKSTNQGS